MSLLLLLLLTVACLPLAWPEPRFGPNPNASATFAAVAVVGMLLYARFITRQTLDRLAHDPDSVAMTHRVFRNRRMTFFLLNLAVYAAIMLVGGWAWTVKQMLTVDGFYLPGAELLILAPYLVVQVGSWAILHDAERELHSTVRDGDFWSRGGHVLFQFRGQALMVYLPLALTIVQLGIIRQFPSIVDSVWAKVGALGGVLAISLVLPSLLPLLLGLRRMPAGPIRDRLERSAARLGVGYRHLYVWDTRGNVATAMVTGLLPRLRHIVFTDLVLATMPHDEIEAILGHEVGHVRHGHLLYYPLFLMLSFIALGALYRGGEILFGTHVPDDSWVLLLGLAATGGYLLVIFGFLSRRCERQADVFGCKAMSCGDPTCEGHDADTRLVDRGRGFCRTGVATFVRALERVEAVNGMSRPNRPAGGGVVSLMVVAFLRVRTWLSTWQHSTIARRVAYLKWLAEDPGRERHFQRRMQVFRWGLLLLLISVSGSMVLWNGWSALVEGM